MKHYITFTLLLLFTHQHLLSMDPQIIKPSCIILSDEKPPKRFEVPLSLMMQCQIFKDLVEDIGSHIIPEYHLQNSSNKDVEHFVRYLKIIDSVKELKTQNGKLFTEQANTEVLNRIKYIRKLSHNDLKTLAINIDVLNVIDENNHVHLTNELTRRLICMSETERPSFYELNNRPILRPVMQEVSESYVNFEESLIQPYSNELTEYSSLPRTIPLPIVLYLNLRNIMTAPFRILTSWLWTAKTITQPCYLNNQTGTIITGIIWKMGKKIQTIGLCIDKKNPDRNITIPTRDMGIKKIGIIEANVDESAFICRSSNTNPILINLHDMTTCHSFKDYAFIDNNDELYVITDKEFGTLNIKTNNFTILKRMDDASSFSRIRTNKKGNIIIIKQEIADHRTTYLGQRNNNGQFSFEQLVIDYAGYIHFKNDIPTKKINDSKYINPDEICFHPYDNKIYVISGIRQFYIGATSAHRSEESNNKYELCCIDLDTHKITNSMELPHAFFYLQFLPYADNILLLSNIYGTDYFINTKTKHFWTKKKSNDFCKRIALTTDGKYSIEKIKEHHLFLNLMLTFINPNRTSSNNIVTKKIVATPLIDNAMIETIKKINGGFLPIAVLNIAKSKLANILSPEDKEQIESLSKETQKVIRFSPTNAEWKKSLMAGTLVAIFALVYFILNTQKTIGGIEANTITAILGSGALTTFFIKQIASQY